MNDVHIFANPIAGRGQGRPTALAIQEKLKSAGFTPHVCLDRCDLAPLPGRPPLAAISIGGDGTLRQVAAWNLRAAALTQRPAPILVVAMGTANIMAQHLGIRRADRHTPDLVLASLRARRILDVDAAHANGELFLLIAGVGIDGAIIHELDRIRSGPITKLSYFRPSVASFFKYAFPDIAVRVDGREIFPRQPGMAFIANVPEYGGGFPLLLHAKPNDGLLDVLAVPCDGRMQMLSLFTHAMAGNHLQQEGVVYAQGRSIEVTSPAPAPIQIDGEPAGFAPLKIDLLPDRLPFLLPAS